MTCRYEPRLQAFGLEPKACSRYGWEFFLLFCLGLSFLFESLSGEIRTQISRNFYFRGKSVLEDFSNFSFVLGFLDPRSNLFPTEDHEGVRIGSGGNPNNEERRRSRESFLIHQIDRSSFVARKQRIFAVLF